MECPVSSPQPVTKQSALKCSFFLSICTLIYWGVGKFCAHIGFAEYLLIGNVSVCIGNSKEGWKTSWAEEDLGKPALCQISAKTNGWVCLLSLKSKPDLCYLLLFLLIYQVETSLVIGNKPWEFIEESGPDGSSAESPSNSTAVHCLPSAGSQHQQRRCLWNKQ